MPINTMPRKRIPKGIIVLGILLAGLVGALAGNYSASVYNSIGPLFVVVRSTILFIAGIFSFVLAYGLYKGAKWGWWLGVIVSIVLILTILTFNIISCVLGVVIFYYLTKRKTIRYFKMFEGQSSLEYITTYAWALVVVAVAIAAIFVYSTAPSQVVTNTCNFASGLYCNDVLAGTNSLNQITSVALIVTDSQQAPIANAMIFVRTNNQNTTAVPCTTNSIVPDNSIAPGSSVLCVANLPTYSAPGSLVAGTAYINATYCGLSVGSYSSTHTCKGGLPQTYLATFTVHAQPSLTQTATLTLSVLGSPPSLGVGIPTYNLAKGAQAILNAKVFLFGYPLSGSSINFTLNNSGSVLSPGRVLTNSAGLAASTVTGTTVGKTKITAYSDGLSGSVLVIYH